MGYISKYEQLEANKISFFTQGYVVHINFKKNEKASEHICVYMLQSMSLISQYVFWLIHSGNVHIDWKFQSVFILTEKWDS